MDLGRYTIVHIGSPLLTFFTSEPDRFGVVNPRYLIQDLNSRAQDTERSLYDSSTVSGAFTYPPIHYLINELPWLKRGYAL